MFPRDGAAGGDNGTPS